MMNDRAEGGDGTGPSAEEKVLRDMVERTREDKRAFFRDDAAIAAACRLRLFDPAAFLDVRNELKAAGCPMTEFNRVLNNWSKVEGERLREKFSDKDLPKGFVRVGDNIC